ncbi:hypothetical protein AK88_02760 [Plasmodium fragile]|uniref:PPM-type phosphatase domain-containing protein n=1 Tax=Plasmodium fragile TaxID=5857 RepID=A0A0D9QLE2_PLAFR|nr:uncharacterized protein AK88_02760 [Plasmodium fragile]KJP87592.1 hypothetical protein AK88_02760 [Plasmodium fragile]
MFTRDTDESELEDEGGDNSFRGDTGDDEINGMSDTGTSEVEVQTVIRGGDTPYGKTRNEDKADAARKGKDATVRMDVEDYTDKETHPAQGVSSEDPFEEVASPIIQGGNKAYVKNEQVDSIHVKARKVGSGGEEEEELPGGGEAYGYESDENDTSGRDQNGDGHVSLSDAGINGNGDPSSIVPEDVLIRREGEIGDSHRRRGQNFSGEGLYTFEDEERQHNHVMKKGYGKMINDNIIDTMVHKTFNNIKYDTSNDGALVGDADGAELGSGGQNIRRHKRCAPLFDDAGVKKEGEKKKVKKYEHEARVKGEEGAEYQVVRSKGGSQAKVRTKEEPRGGEVETTSTANPSGEPSRTDNFHLYCQNHDKIFGDGNGRDFFKSGTGGMTGCVHSGDMHNGDTGSDGVDAPDSSSSPLGREKSEHIWKNELGEISNIIYDTNEHDHPMEEENQVGDKGGTNQVGGNGGEHKMIYPSIYEKDKKEWFLANSNDEWLVHKLCDWLYNPKDRLYFNIRTQGIYYVKDGSFLKFENSFEERGDVSVSRSGSDDVHKNSFSFEVNSDDPLLNKKGKTCSKADGGTVYRNMNDMVNDHSVRANPCVSVEESGSMGSNSSRMISRSSSGGRGTAAETGSIILRGDKREQRNGVLTRGSTSSESAAREDYSGDNRSSDNRSSDCRSSDNRSSDHRSSDRRSSGRRPASRENAEANDETVEEFSMVLEDDLVCGTYSKMGDHNRCENEDFYVTKDILDLNNVSESDGLCFFSGVFDGHGGSTCARYVMNHLKTNVIAKFRQSFLITCKKQTNEKETKLNDLSVEIRALYDSCIKGFDMTDKNYIELAKKNNCNDGSTACVVLIYGPDDDGSLKVLCANCGDSGALICHDRKPVKLSLRHKPDLQEERVRILKCGGIIANINGINRIITKHKVKGQTGREKTFLALSTSRSFGDISYKVPRKIVLCKPFISVYTIDFDLDSFLVLATDGILNVLTDKEIIDIVWRNIHRKPEEAAEEVVHEASRRDSTDDKTCTVIFFYWRKDIFRGESEDASVEAPPREEAPGEDINMFSEVF